jgi:hypothetical protein
MITIAPGSISQAWIDEESDIDDESDPEGVGTILCVSPTLDKNTKDNSLAFVLECCELSMLIPCSSNNWYCV